LDSAEAASDRQSILDRWIRMDVNLDAQFKLIYEGWNFNSGNYLFTTDTK